MGTSCFAVVEPGGSSSEMLEVAAAEVGRLEAKFSRFRPDSELCRLNENSGGIASSEFAMVVGVAYAMALRTRGLFDPAMLDAIESAGYDRDFSELAPPEPAGAAVNRSASGPIGRSGTWRDIRLRGSQLSLLNGSKLDLGGVVKGWAAQRVAETLGSSRGALVDLGGDCYMVPPGPLDGSWPVGIDHGESDLPVVLIERGAICTSTTLKRRWFADSRVRHHVLDPETCAPAETDLVAATVIGECGATADAFAKAALIGGSRRGMTLMAAVGADAIATGSSGKIYGVGDCFTGETETRSLRIRAGDPASNWRSKTNSTVPSPG